MKSMAEEVPPTRTTLQAAVSLPTNAGLRTDKGALAYAASKRESEDVKSNRAELRGSKL